MWEMYGPWWSAFTYICVTLFILKLLSGSTEVQPKHRSDCGDRLEKQKEHMCHVSVHLIQSTIDQFIQLSYAEK
jgi:hypothetical protein